jgi:hypothetical protein
MNELVAGQKGTVVKIPRPTVKIDDITNVIVRLNNNTNIFLDVFII